MGAVNFTDRSDLYLIPIGIYLCHSAIQSVFLIGIVYLAGCSIFFF